MGRNEKAIWTSLMVLLLLFEVRTLYLDRDEHDAEQAQARCEEIERFGQIAGQLQQAIKESEQQFGITIEGVQEASDKARVASEKAAEAVDAITGGKSYCYAVGSFLSKEWVSLGLVTRGSSPLHDIQFEIVDVDKEQKLLSKQPFSMYLRSQFVSPQPMVPFLSSNAIRGIGEYSLAGVERRKLHFNFYSMNGNWQEDFSIRLVKGQWTQAFTVAREVRNGDRARPTYKVIYRYIAPDYPRLKDGRPDW